jgi:hypothetical protein
MPTTPVNQTSTNSFGLLTPCTPNFDGFAKFGGEIAQTMRAGDVVVEREDSENDKPLRTQFDELQQQIKDAELAANLAQEGTLTGQRRSTRIAKKDTLKGKLATACHKSVTLTVL